MRYRRRVIRSVGIGALVAALAVTAACNSAPGDRGQKPKTGGTLTVILSRSSIAHLDPGQIYLATDANISRLITRTLTTYRSEAGGSGEIVGDLATDTGRPSENNTVWDFTLKKDVKWEDGSPITCDQLRYGVERTFATTIDPTTGEKTLLYPGLGYTRIYLKDNAVHYEGPFVGGDNGGKGLESIVCVDSRTIRFKLSSSVGDFGYAVTTEGFAPVPREADTGDKMAYDLHVMANGPYKISSWKGATQADKSPNLVLTRNNNWVRETDPVRKAYPDKIVIRTMDNQDEVTNRMIESRGDDKYAINVDADVAPTFIQQVINDPTLDARAIKGSFSGIRYFAINMENVADLKCRQAMEYAFNKRKYRAAIGGASLGDLASTILPPLLISHKDFDLYGTTSKPDGDPDKAATLLKDMKDAGTPCPGTPGAEHPIRLAYPNIPSLKRPMSTVVEAFALAGMTIDAQPQDPDFYYDTLGKVAHHPNDFELIYGGWAADWNNGSAMIPPLFDGRGLVPDGNINFSMLNDPEVNQMIKDAISEANPARQNALWGELDAKIMQMGAVIPVIYIRSIRMAGDQIRGAYISPILGQPDLVAIGLADGGASPSAG
jgi:peptide/nickel transport system substrate-binding protein